MNYKLLSAILFAAVLFSPVCHASTYRLHGPSFQLSQNNQSLDQAVEQIKQQTGGRILSARTIKKNGNHIHQIKVLLPSGKVRIYNVNAR